MELRNNYSFSFWYTARLRSPENNSNGSSEAEPLAERISDGTTGDVPVLVRETSVTETNENGNVCSTNESVVYEVFRWGLNSDSNIMTPSERMNNKTICDIVTIVS